MIEIEPKNDQTDSVGAIKPIERSLTLTGATRFYLREFWNNLSERPKPSEGLIYYRPY